MIGYVNAFLVNILSTQFIYPLAGYVKAPDQIPKKGYFAVQTTSPAR
jgi:hypothetical protein